MSQVTTSTPTEDRIERIQQLMRLPIPELALALSEETSKFLKHRESDDLVGLALFTIAIVQRDDGAWTSLYRQYAPLVLTWVTQHQSTTPLLGQDGSADPLVNAVFAKFSLALTPDKMANFDSLGAVLKYLKMCVNSVVSDEVRSRQARRCEEMLDANEHEIASDDPVETVISTISAQNLWSIIQAELKGEHEQQLMYLTCVLGMKPREIWSEHRRLFPTLDDVYRVKRNVLERLRRCHQLQQMLSA